MSLYERSKQMTVEEMADSRVHLNSKVICHSNADNWTYYDYWYETSDGKHFGNYEREKAVEHEIELLLED